MDGCMDGCMGWSWVGLGFSLISNTLFGPSTSCVCTILSDVVSMSTVLPVGQERPSTQGMQIPFFSLAAFNGTIPQAKSENWKCFRIIMFKDFGFEHLHSTHTPTHATFLVVKRKSVLPLLQSIRKPRSPLAALQSPSHKKHKCFSFRRQVFLKFFGFSASPCFSQKEIRQNPRTRMCQRKLRQHALLQQHAEPHMMKRYIIYLVI